MTRLKKFGLAAILVACALFSAGAASSNTPACGEAFEATAPAVASKVAEAGTNAAYGNSTATSMPAEKQQAMLLPAATSAAATIGFNPANVQTVPGTQQPIRTTMMSNGRQLKYYTAQGEESVTHEKCVILSIQRGTNTWWDRRCIRFKELNELNPCAAEGGCMSTEPALRSFLGGLYDVIHSAVTSLANALTGAAHQFADYLRAVGQLFTGWGKRLTDAADAIDKNAAAFYAKAVTDVAPIATMKTHVKLQRAFNKAIDLDSSGKTALVLATAALNMP